MSIENQNQGATQAPTVEARPDGQQSAAQATTSDERPANLREVVEMRKENRAIAKKLDDVLAAIQAPKTTPSPAEAKRSEQAASGTDVSAELAKLKADLALKDALADRGLDKGQRKIVERLFAAERPPNVDEWLDATLESLGPKQPAPAAAAPTTAATAPAGAPSNTGAPAGGRGLQLPSNAALLPKEVLDSMSDAEAVRYYETIKRAAGPIQGNPFAFKKLARQGGDAAGNVQQLAALIGKELKR